jgi:hypothetical protein
VVLCLNKAGFLLGLVEAAAAKPLFLFCFSHWALVGLSLAAVKGAWRRGGTLAA